MPNMYDSIYASALPPTGAAAYAGYVDGHWPDYLAIVQRFPGVPVLSIAVTADDDADCLDVENGDAVNARGPGWVQRQIARGVWLPCLYTPVGNAMALLATGVQRTRIRLWTAHWTGVPHLCGPQCGFGLTTTADATQWTDRAFHGTCDESLTTADFFGAPTPLPPIANYPEDHMQAIPITVELAGGHGWVPSPVPAASVVNVTINDENPDVVGRYDGLPSFQGVATQGGPHSENGALMFDGPDGRWGAVVWAAA